MRNVSFKIGRISGGEYCPDTLPNSLGYHSRDNPSGARCDVSKHYANLYGRDPASGFARRPLDNIGVQFGLRTLNEGVISIAKSLDLNDRIGSR